MSAITSHTYPDLLHSGDRLACTEWAQDLTTSQAVAATLRHESQAVILRAVTHEGYSRGLAPGGLG